MGCCGFAAFPWLPVCVLLLRSCQCVQGSSRALLLLPLLCFDAAWCWLEVWVIQARLQQELTDGKRIKVLSVYSTHKLCPESVLEKKKNNLKDVTFHSDLAKWNAHFDYQNVLVLVLIYVLISAILALTLYRIKPNLAASHTTILFLFFKYLPKINSVLSEFLIWF